MAHIFWNKGEKAGRKEVVDELMRELVNVTDTPFTAKVESDDAGSNVVAYIERDLQGNIPDKKDLPEKFLGWRLLVIHVHEGYIKHIMSRTPYDE